MRAPAFWWRPRGAPGLLARLFWPLTVLWRAGAALRRRRARPWRAPVPVICVGNLTAGGAGKTPMVAQLVRRLEAAGRRPHVLTRGHGGRIRGPHLVDPERDTHRDVGDEALLHAALAPVWVARDRAAGARAAAAAGAGAIVMDDGMQNPGLAKDAVILMVDAGQGFGNGRLLPAGPLREPVAEGLARASVVVLTGGEAERARCLADWPELAAADPVTAALEPVATGLPLAGAPVVAFAGIGRPAKFFATLERLGARIVAAEPFPDHHVYGPRVIDRLVRRAREAGAMLVTTEKDAVRLAPRQRREVMVVQVALVPADWSRIDAAAGL